MKYLNYNYETDSIKLHYGSTRMIGQMKEQSYLKIMAPIRRYAEGFRGC